MRTIECVTGKRLDFREDLIGDFLRNTAFSGSFHKVRPLLVHFGLFLLTHRAAEKVCLSKCKSSDSLYDFQNLILVDDDAIRFTENGLKGRVCVLNLGWIKLRADVARDVVHWTGAVERHHRSELFYTPRL